MFKSKKETDPTKHKNGLPAINMISEKTRLTGDFHTDDGLRVSGLIKGNITSGGKCIILATASVEGGITANEADIYGTVTGDIVVKDRLILRETAKLEGNIHARVLVVEAGCQFFGTCTMGTDPAGSIKEKAEEPLNFRLTKVINE